MKIITRIIASAVIMIVGSWHHNSAIAQNRSFPVNAKGEIIIARVEIDGTQALIDTCGNFIIPPGKYEKIDLDDFKEGMCAVKRNGKWGYVDLNCNEVIPCEWDWVIGFEGGLSIIAKRDENGWGRDGVIDKNGNVIVPPIYATLMRVEGADLFYTEGPTSLINFKGETVLSNVFSTSFRCFDERIKVSLTGNYGGHTYVDSEGQRKLGKYYRGNGFSHGYAVVAIRDENQGEQLAYIDPDGNQYLLGQYDVLGDFYGDGYAVVKCDNKCGVINNRFEEVIPCEYDDIETLGGKWHENLFTYGLTQVKKDGQWGIINVHNEIVIPIGKYYSFWMWKGDNAITVATNNTYDYFNMDEKQLTDHTDILTDTLGCALTTREYEHTSSFYNGFATAQRDGKSGIINDKGEEVISCSYDFGFWYPNKEYADLGVIKIKQGNKWCLINRNEEMIAPCIYDEIIDFKEGLAIVRRGNKVGAIDLSGKEVLPLKYVTSLHISRTSRGFDYGRFNNCRYISGAWKWGFIDKKGEEVIPCIYDKVYPFKKIIF